MSLDFDAFLLWGRFYDWINLNFHVMGLRLLSFLNDNLLLLLFLLGIGECPTFEIGVIDWWSIVTICIRWWITFLTPPIFTRTIIDRLFFHYYNFLFNFFKLLEQLHSHPLLFFHVDPMLFGQLPLLLFQVPQYLPLLFFMAILKHLDPPFKVFLCSPFLVFDSVSEVSQFVGIVYFTSGAALLNNYFFFYSSYALTDACLGFLLREVVVVPYSGDSHWILEPQVLYIVRMVMVI